ncbi:hypothetical protein Dsin_003060 [Dipteronia sinensis]|uniref:Uncharacterized protein n=1 Tax=Dipteronia sinensis TaxID=43782 RepID=A0AAE0B897_9ROSI|nr:hypothetical protein Dsin_003060 [Dipteronia sinensis]
MGQLGEIYASRSPSSYISTVLNTTTGSVVDKVGDKTTRSIFAQQEQAHHSKTSQEFLSEGGGTRRL